MMDEELTGADVTFSTLTGDDGADRIIIPLLECSSGEPYSYIIPSFQVLDVQLRRVKYEVNLPSKDITVVLDGFIKDDSTLDGSYPTQIAVLAGARHHCLVEVNYKYSHKS